MSDQPQTNSSLSDSIREVIESGKDVAENVRSMVVGLLQQPSGPVDSVRSSVNEIMKTAEDVVRRAAPEDADSVLRKVIDGVASGVQTVAQTTGYAVQEARARGERFANDDMDFAARNLKAAGDMLMETLKYATERASFESKTAASELKTHAERAVEAVKPTVVSTVDALRDSPVQLASEASGAVVRSGRLAAGALLSAVSGMLAGAAEMLDPDRTKQGDTPSQRADGKEPLAEQAE